MLVEISSHLGQLYIPCPTICILSQPQLDPDSTNLPNHALTHSLHSTLQPGSLSTTIPRPPPPQAGNASPWSLHYQVYQCLYCRYFPLFYNPTHMQCLKQRTTKFQRKGVPVNVPKWMEGGICGRANERTHSQDLCSRIFMSERKIVQPSSNRYTPSVRSSWVSELVKFLNTVFNLGPPKI